MENMIHYDIRRREEVIEELDRVSNYFLRGSKVMQDISLMKQHLLEEIMAYREKKVGG
jgi:hypothetical protein